MQNKVKQSSKLDITIEKYKLTSEKS